MKQYLLVLPLFLIANQTVSAYCTESITDQRPNEDFIVNGQEVTDITTGLIWQKCALGLTGDNCTIGRALPLSLESAHQLAQEAGKGWRVPNIKELLSLVRFSCQQPAINSFVFPHKGGTTFISATPIKKNYFNKLVTYNVKFSGGSVTTGGGSAIRLVRTGENFYHK